MLGPDKPSKRFTPETGAVESTGDDLRAKSAAVNHQRLVGESVPKGDRERPKQERPADTPNSSPGARRRVIRDIVMILVGAGLTWTCTRLLNTAFPESPKEVVIPEAAKTLRWSVKHRRISEEEKRKLDLLRRNAPEAGVLAIYLENDSDTHLNTVGLLVECDKPIIAHMLPLALRVTDMSGQAITDQVRHFAYERLARLTYHNVPSKFSMIIPFVVPNRCKYHVYCQIDDRFVPSVEWPESVKVEDDIFQSVFYESNTAGMP
jgi:hypothetical protein